MKPILRVPVRGGLTVRVYADQPLDVDQWEDLGKHVMLAALAADAASSFRRALDRAVLALGHQTDALDALKALAVEIEKLRLAEEGGGGD